VTGVSLTRWCQSGLRLVNFNSFLVSGVNMGALFWLILITGKPMCSLMDVSLLFRFLHRWLLLKPFRCVVHFAICMRRWMFFEGTEQSPLT
jgi:hypothetical protein